MHMYMSLDGKKYSGSLSSSEFSLSAKRRFLSYLQSCLPFSQSQSSAHVFLYVVFYICVASINIHRSYKGNEKEKNKYLAVLVENRMVL